jgi:molybdopterin-guanine dinucleotide biosynthesis protein A
MGADAAAIDGLILAGGRSSRMGGLDKALTALAGRPLLQRVIDRVAPQVRELALSVERESVALAGFGLPQLPDPRPGYQGPLGGLLSGLRHFAPRRGWLLLAPCDAPFLPPDLAERLRDGAERAQAPAALAVQGGAWQPTFSIWRHDLLPLLEHAVGRDGEAGLKPFLRAVGAAECAWPPDGLQDGIADGPPPFFNINDPSALEEARRWINEATAVRQQC